MNHKRHLILASALFLLASHGVRADELEVNYGKYSGSHAGAPCFVSLNKASAETGYRTVTIRQIPNDIPTGGLTGDALYEAIHKNIGEITEFDVSDEKVSQKTWGTRVNAKMWTWLGPIKATATMRIDLDDRHELKSVQTTYSNGIFGLGGRLKTSCENLKPRN